MIGNTIDTVWSAMRIGELYTPGDPANATEQSRVSVLRVLEFLEDIWIHGAANEMRTDLQEGFGLSKPCRCPRRFAYSQ